MKKLHHAAALVLGFALLAGACSFGKDKSIAETGVTQFHDQFNAGEFRAIYVQSGDQMKKAIQQADFVKLLEAIRHKLGTVQRTTLTGWHVNMTTFGTFASLIYSTEFSEGKGTESFSFSIADDRAMLEGYNVDSPALVLK